MTKAGSEFFHTAGLRSDLKGRSVRGGAVTLLAQGAKLALQTASIVLLARLLTPAEFGLVAMVVAVTRLVLMLKDLGLSMATVQQAEINHAQVSTLFWINVAVSVLLSAAVAGLAPAIAWFYDEPRLLFITFVLSISFLFSGLTAQHQALLRRQMRYRQLGLIDVSASAFSVLVGISTALLGWSYWSLVAMYIAMPAATMVGTWLACPWRPGKAVRGAGVRSMLAFGGHLTGFNLSLYFTQNVDNILIGWRWGAQSLGLYSRAYNLLLFPLQQINPPIAAVAIPALSRLQDDPSRYRAYYLKAVSFQLFCTLPLTVLLLLAAKETILLFLGPQWVGATTIFQCFAAAALTRPLLNSTGWLYLSSGRTRRMFQWGICSALVICSAFVVGLPYGPTGVALSYATAATLLTLPGLHVALRGTGISLGDVLRCLRVVGTSALLAGALTIAVRYWIGPSLTALASMALTVATMATSYLLLVLWAFGQYKVYRDLFNELRRSRSE